MRAVTYREPGVVRSETVPDAEIVADTDVLVRVEAAGICGSDLHVYLGRERGLDAGTVLGHEFLGRIVATGPRVARFRVGDRVVSPFTTSCGRCFYCTRGLTARCLEGQLFGWVENGAGLHGGQAEAVRVPLADSTLVAAPDDLGAEAALLLGDVLTTGWHAARGAEAGPGVVCAVIGCGPVGLAAVLCARELGADTVLAIDTVDERLALAQSFGAIPVDARFGPAADRVRAETDGRGADAVLEAVGSPDAARLAFELVRPGGTISVVGVHHEPHFAFSPAQAYDKNLTYRSGRCPARALMEVVLPLARRREADLERIFTHRAALADGPAAYEMFAARRDGCIKVLLGPS